MSQYETENKNLYRFNINEIPIDKLHSEKVGLNSGTVQLKCFINSHCPFVKSPKEEDIIIFNSQTVDTIKGALPDNFKNIITTLPNLEGLFFLPKYTYRHNFLVYNYDLGWMNHMGPMAYLASQRTVSDVIEKLRGEDIDDNDNIYSLPGSIGDTLAYTEEQTWISVNSVFTTHVLEGIQDKGFEGVSEYLNSLCTAFPVWAYTLMSLTNDMNSIDVQNDLNIPIASSFFKRLVQGYKYIHSIQFLEQTSTQNCIGDGIHWRLLKKTPLYKGEDFFIEFHKRAITTDVNKEGITPVNFDRHLSRSYLALDATLDPFTNTRFFQDTDYKMPINYAVANYGATKKEEKPEKAPATFHFYDQAYYIIELGYQDPENNYFIIICERSYPIFVHVKDEISFQLGDPFTGIHGGQLLKSDSFRMTVRNHLGKLIIQFEPKGSTPPPPWIIKKYEWDIDFQDEQTGVVKLKEKAFMNLFVPGARMTIWGGNQTCAFSFNPLQYQGGNINFEYPPSPIVSEELANWNPGEEETVKVYTVSPEDPMAVSSTGYMSLPPDVNHQFKFTVSDLDITDTIKQILIPNESPLSQHLFTQDAQWYREYIELSQDTLASSGGRGYKYGSFFFQETLKELSKTPGEEDGEDEDVEKKENSTIKDSIIEVTKYKRIYDSKRRKQIFNMIISLQVGDHIFGKDEILPRTGKPYIRKLSRGSNEETEEVVSGQWILANCKTPVMTHIRLCADESFSPRWEDGTNKYTQYQGIPFYKKTPLDDTPPYLIDASNHVMHYSDSWSAIDFNFIEHTGTIKFLLNRNINVTEEGELGDFYNVTEELLNLQDKNFYIEVWAGYAGSEVSGIGSRLNVEGCNYSRIPGFFKLFTGICPGGTIEYSYGKRIMTCKISDYTKVLKDQRIFNSPFYDGVKDCNAVFSLLQLAGFRSVSAFEPAFLLRQMADNVDFLDQIDHLHIDGRKFRVLPYALPSQYQRLEQPAFKFTMGTPLYDCISQITERSAKLFFFDQHGIAHFENFLDVVQKVSLGELDYVPSFQFTSNPDNYDGQMIFNRLEESLNVENIYNHLKIVSTTPDRELLMGDDLEWNSFDNPNSSGFIGYLKTLFQMEGMFGSEGALKSILYFYRIMFKAEIQDTFETYGLPIRALDIVSVDGLACRVSEVSHNIDPEQNRWWMNVVCHRYQPIDKKE